MLTFFHTKEKSVMEKEMLSMSEARLFTVYNVMHC